MKKTSKRIFSVAISLMLVFLMAITSSAATITSLTAAVGNDADRTVNVTVLYENVEEAQESTLLVVKKGVSIVTATADQVRYIDQKTVNGNSVTYSFKMAAGDRIGEYDLYVGGTKVDAPSQTVVSFSTDALTTIKFVNAAGAEIATSAQVASNIGDIIDLTSYAPQIITVGETIYVKNASNPATFTANAATNEVTITYSLVANVSDSDSDSNSDSVIAMLGGEVLWSCPEGTFNDTPVAQAWPGWSVTTVADTNVNVKTYSVGNTLQIYKGDANDNDMGFTLTSPSYGDGAEIVILEWVHKTQIAPGGNGDLYFNFAYKDINGVEIFRANMDKNDTSVDDASPFGFPVEGTKLAFAAYNNADGTTHTVDCYVAGKIVHTMTVDGVINGFGSIVGSWGPYASNWNHMGYANLAIGAVYPAGETEVEVTATYMADGKAVKSLTGRYDTAAGEAGVAFDALIYTANGSNGIYRSELTVLSESGTIVMTKDENPGPYAIGDTIDYDSKQYNVVSENLIPNGDFSQGTLAWFGGDGKQLGASVANNAVTLGNAGGGDNKSLKQSWAIESGKTYLYTYNTSAGNTWHITSLQNALNSDENTTKAPVLVGTTDKSTIVGTLAASDSTGTNNFVFTNTGGYAYLQSAFRWTSATFSDFALYEIEENTATYKTVTVSYDYNGTTLATEVLEGTAGGTVTAPAKSIEVTNGIVIFEAKDYTVGNTATEVTLTHSKFISLEGGLVANYNFANGDVTDAVNGFNGNVIGAAGVTFNENGYVTLPGGIAQGAMTIPNEIMKYLTGDFTVSMWVKQDSSYASDGKAVAFWDMANGDYDRLFYQMAGTGITVQHRGENPSRVYTTYTNNATKDNWALVTAVFDLDASTLTTYINGESLGAGTTTGTWGTGHSPANVLSRGNTTFYLGHNHWNNGDNPELKGDMADVRIYNKALTADEVAALMGAKKTVTVKYMADGAEITGSSAVEYFSTSATFTIPTAVTGDNGRAYALTGFDYAEGTENVTVTASEEEYVAQYVSVDAIPTGIKAIPAVTVISGNAPVLPATVTVLTNKAGIEYTANVTWNTANLVVGTNTVTGTVEGFDVDATVSVTVLENTFALSDITTVNGQDAGKSSQVEFPVAISDEFSIEFTANYASFGDLWITLKTADAGFFGPEQVPLGVNASGAFRPVNGNGSGSRAADDFDHVKLTTGVNYRFFITTDASTDKYSVTVTNEATGEVVDAFENYGYRTNATAIEAITSLTNNGAGSVTLTNIKVSAPSADVDTYTVNAVAGNTTLGTFTGVASDTSKLGYNNQVVYPNVTIPAYDGYVFKNKTVSGTTVTLNYEAVEEAGFFDNVANDTKFVSLNMLGAHDAFTSNVASGNKDAAGVAQGDSGSRGALTGLGAATSKAQSEDVLTMLNHGVRYFDIRLSRSDSNSTYLLMTANHTNGVFYTTHGYLGEEFRPIAHTIAQWAKAHPGEIVVLDFQEMWDKTSTAGSSGDSVAQSWTDLNNLLTEAGIYDYVTINNGTDLSAVTYGSLTNNGEKAGIVLFGRAVATNASVGSFILRGDTSAAFNGKMYSNYSFGGASVSSSSLANTYIQAQVDHAYTQTGTVNNMYRVMQAISSTSDLINQADDDNTFITNAVQNNPTWLTTLPVIMVNDATVNTSDLLKILKACNEPVDVQMNYTIGGTVTDTNTTKLMVGTLYTGTVVGALVSGLNGEYAVTEALGETPVPYNGSITLAVEKLGNVYSTRIENGAHSVYSGTLDDAKVYAGKTNFAAYTWGQDNDRLGVAVLTAEAGKSAYALSANVVRKDFNQSYRNVKFYVLPVSEYRALNLQDKNALLAKLNDNTLVADINPDDYGVGTQQIALDAVKIAAAAEGGDVVIIGNAQGGLYGMEGASMAILAGYNVTVNGGGATIAYGTYTLPSDAIAYHKEGTTEVYKPGSAAPITADTNFVPYYALGADMVDGAQVRIGDGVDENGKVSTGSGLRFLTIVNRTDALASLADEGVEMEFGVEVTAEGSSVAPVVIKAVEWQVDDAVFTSAVTNLAEGNYNRKYTATPYIKIGENVFYGTPVTRSIYQVAAGLLANPDADNTDYDDVVLASKPLYDVLNAYVNQTGVRLTLSDISETATLTARTGEAKGAYTGEAFFTVGATTYADGKYTVTLTAVGKSEINTKLFNEYVRINNNNSLVSPVTTITDNGDKTYTIVFDYSNMQQ